MDNCRIEVKWPADMRLRRRQAPSIAVALLSVVLAACRGVGPPPDAVDSPTAKADVIGEQRIDSGWVNAGQSTIVAAADPMSLVDFRQAYTIEIGRFADETAALTFGRALPLQHAEMGVACQAVDGEHYYLLGYGLYLGNAEAERVASLLAQRTDLPLASEPVLRRLDQVQANSAEPPCAN